MAMTDNSKKNYDDILNLPHHVSAHHTRMSMHDRAAQFSPFAALTGLGAAVDEAGRSMTAEDIPVYRADEDGHMII